MASIQVIRKKMMNQDQCSFTVMPKNLPMGIPPLNIAVSSVGVGAKPEWCSAARVPARLRVYKIPQILFGAGRTARIDMALILAFSLVRKREWRIEQCKVDCLREK